MPAPRKPTELMRLAGSFKHDPARGRARANEPVVEEPLGPPPACLNEAQCARWQELAAEAYWLTAADRVIVEQTARLWQTIRDGTATAAEQKLLSQNLAKLGMTPADRSRVQAPRRPATRNPFEVIA